MEHNHGPEKWFFLFWRQCWSSEKKTLPLYLFTHTLCVAAKHVSFAYGFCLIPDLST